MLEPELYTVDDFYALVPDGQKGDLIDGVIYLASPDSEKNDKLNVFLLGLMSMFAEERCGGRVSGSRFAYRLSDYRAPEPDVAFVAKERLEAVITKREGIGPPDVAVEIVSRDSRSRDHVEKRHLYETSGVQEYWLIDPLQGRCEFYHLEGGRYQLVPLTENRFFHSRAMPGFWLNVEWLVGETVPKAYACLKELLA